MKKYSQYRDGLSFEIRSMTKSDGKIIMNAELYNPDTFDHYYLDPDKMGRGLYHYFANGLYLRDHKYYTHHKTIIHPEPRSSWNSWSKEWLSLIKSEERKKISLMYDHFKEIPQGEYHYFF